MQFSANSAVSGGLPEECAAIRAGLLARADHIRRHPGMPPPQPAMPNLDRVQASRADVHGLDIRYGTISWGNLTGAVGQDTVRADGVRAYQTDGLVAGGLGGADRTPPMPLQPQREREGGDAHLRELSRQGITRVAKVAPKDDGLSMQ